MSDNLLICDLTQSWSPTAGGGISTYLKEKKRFFQENTQHRLLQIVPGPEDKITVEGRTILPKWVRARFGAAPTIAGSAATMRCLICCANINPTLSKVCARGCCPGSRSRHRLRHPDTALVAGYRTDFPNAQVYRVAKDLFGPTLGMGFKQISMAYAWMTYHRFDRVYTLNHEAKRMLAGLGYHNTGVLGLGVNIDQFSPDHRDDGYRAELGLPESDGPLLIYAGRLDNEKRAYVLTEMFKQLPRDMGAQMVLLGDGKLRETLMEEARGFPIAFPGYETNRRALARALASSDIYVSGMADETFGISVLEAQASGLPVVGVASGSMPERVPEGTGYLGPVDDALAMAQNVTRLWREDYASARNRSIALANSHNRWPQTFEQLINVEYPEALKARDARRNGSFRGQLKRALNVS